MPLRASSSILCRLSTAALGSSRSMNAASSTLPMVPISGSFSSSFLPTDVKLSLISRPAMNGSTWLRWLNRKTAGRCAVRFSSPMTLRSIPIDAISSRVHVEVKKLTPGAAIARQQPEAERTGRGGHQRGDACDGAQLRDRAAAAAAGESQHGPTTFGGNGCQLAAGVGGTRVADEIHQRDVLVAVGVEVALGQIDAVLRREGLHRPGLARAPDDRRLDLAGDAGRRRRSRTCCSRRCRCRGTWRPARPGPSAPTS